MSDIVERARDFPHNTCAASRHAQLIGESMERGAFFCDGDSEMQRHAGESILATVAALYEARTALAERRWTPITDTERLAIEWAAAIAGQQSQAAVHKTLRALLERTKTVEK